ncbi:type VII secretion protein EssC [Butyrivibrio proteoclasticus]|uniref:type VII secretion protein EssC n=1 Tax=Butyrivibrio proteoclasticus TaxID=43305 RepID=UPI0006860562|nr:type VII secretion protein EssC [Butyrivibrio proteoclasticus]
MNYKLTIYNNKLYKEITLTPDHDKITIGTGKENRVCLSGKNFWKDFTFEIVANEGGYIATAASDIYFKSDSAIKEKMHILKSGESLEICDDESGSNLVFLEFCEDFGDKQENYNLQIQLQGAMQFTLGGVPTCDVFINKDVLAGEVITFTRNEQGFMVDSSRSHYGVMVNGFTPRNQTRVQLLNEHFFEYCGFFFYFENDCLYTVDNGFVTSRFKVFDILPQTSHYQYPQYIKSARQQYLDPKEKPEVLPPKNEPTEPRRNLIMILTPILVMLFLMIFIRGRMMTGNKLYIVYFAATMVVSGAMSVWNYFYSIKDFKKKSANRIKVYNEYLDKKEEDLTKMRQSERTVLSEKNRSVEDTIRDIDEFSPRLFEKERDHADYLNVRIGTGRVESLCQVEFRKQEYVETDDMLMNYPEKMHDKYEYIDDMPVVLELAKCNAIGFVGARNKLYQMMKNMLITIAGQHFYNDVKIIMIMDKEDVPYFQWARWLKNVNDESSGQRFIIYDEDSYKQGLEFLYGELSAREAVKEKEKILFSNFVVFVYRSKKFMEHPVKEYVKYAKDMGFSFLFFEEFPEMLHKACDKRVFLEPDKNHGFVQDVLDGESIQYFDYPHIPMEVALHCAKRLAPVYIKELSLESTLTKNISFYQLLGIMSAYDLNLAQRWAESKVYESMGAPLGVKSGDEIIALDLHEKYHGPHGLVAGTTGSGKSEILQSYVLSMATTFHPYDVSFVIIDFKGGGMANQFKNLPHLNGAITNIDGKQIDRSLKSIKAELLKRQELFAKYEVNQIDNYIKLFKEGKADVPLPHLILIVDEFAELKADQPEFMKELISTARIGRSLGVHLILATQKPAGVVNDQIWSNSKFKLCLKVQDKSDSNEVLHSPLAAEIREPGRAYLQVGNNEIFELFQSAYSGAPAFVQSTNTSRKFQISAVDLSGKRTVLYEQKPEKSEASMTQLDAVVDYIEEYCKKNEIAKLPDICLPPLPENIPYPEELPTDSTDIIVPIGIYDDPDRQAQDEFSINFTKNHAFILGSSLSGKTCLMQSMIMGLSTKYSPEDVNIYIIDFASMIMRIFEDMNHVGSVVTITDEDKLKNLFDLLLKKIEDRRRILASKGLSSFGSYREAGYKDQPQIILFVENYVVFRATFPDYEEKFLTICRDGVANGISVVVSSQQMSGIGYKLMTNFSVKIALHCNDRGQYSMLLDRCRIYPDEVAGRGVTVFGTECKEFQSYIAFDAAKEVERISKIQKHIETINAMYPDLRAEAVKYVPSDLDEKYVIRRFGHNDIIDHKLFIGLNYSTTNPEYIDFTANPIFTVIGRENFGKSKFIYYVLGKIMANQDKSKTHLYILDNNNHLLKKYDDTEETKGYVDNVNDTGDIFETVYDIANDRYDEYKEDPSKKQTDPLIMVVVGSKQYLEVIRKDEEILNWFNGIVEKARDSKICLMFTDIDNAPLTSLSNPILKTIRDQGAHVFFENVKDITLINIPRDIVTQIKVAPAMGDTIYIGNGSLRRVKVLLDN